MKIDNGQSLHRIIESALILSWMDLVKDTRAGLVHLEYAFAGNGSLDYLKVWSSITRGHWLLACEYWMAASTFHGKGIHFENGFQSESLTQTLEIIMQNQQAFSPSPNFGRTGLLQIQVPTEEERTSAAMSVSEALCRVNSMPVAPSTV